MGSLSRLRAWINRDDGRFYQAGNCKLGALSVIGGLAMVAAMVLSQLHRHDGLPIAWPIVVGFLGVVLFLVGMYRDGHDDGGG